jgi:ethanolamine utilization protein EutN
MLKATVIGSVWATRRVESVPRGAFLEVESEDGSRLIAFDVLGSGLGERVLIASGSVASGWFAPEHPPIDALIIGSLDEESASAPAAGGGEQTTAKRTTRARGATTRRTKNKES